MRQVARRITTALALGTLVVLLVAAAAGAADYPPSADPTPGSLTLPATVPADGMIDFSGTGCGVSQTVEAAFNGTKITTATTDATGVVAGEFAVPAGTAAGTYTVTVGNDFCSLSGTVEVMAAGTGGQLPFTGSSTIPIVLTALLAVAFGSMLVVAARRRRHAPTSPTT